MTTPIAPAPKLAKIKAISLRETAYRQLRDLIVKQTLPRGTQLVIGQLADELGISRTPLREAIAVNARRIRTGEQTSTLSLRLIPVATQPGGQVW